MDPIIINIKNCDKNMDAIIINVKKCDKNMEEGSDHDIFVCEKCPETFKTVENLASHTVRMNYNALMYIYEIFRILKMNLL